MEMAQEREWAEAQKITVSVDLVEAAKNQLKFLAAVDRNRFFNEDQALERAIYRYNAFWLPLLSKHLETPVSEEPLVVPLDCEFVWHCHRLSPVRYKFDCEKLFGRILGLTNVISSVQATSQNTTQEIWKKMYPEEPYELDLNIPFSKDVLQKGTENLMFTRYDLLSAVKRQIPFGYQVSRPHMSDDLFLREAEARYKGFLHLIRTNMKMRLKRFCVPTYDIDLMWHTHLLHPDLYCRDMIELVGYMVNHDDTKDDTKDDSKDDTKDDSKDDTKDETKEKKLDDGHNETTRQWEETFGFSYWKAGAMSRGDSPTPVTKAPYKFNVDGKELERCGQQIQLQTAKVVEVLLEFFDIKNLPEEHKDNLIVAFSKNQPDKLFSTKRSLGISSDSKQKLFALFQCEPTGEFLFELMSCPPASDALEPKKSLELLGSCSLSFEELLSQSQLSVNKWVPVDLVSGLGNAEPVLLHVSISFSPATPAPQVFQLLHSQPFKNDQTQTQVRVMDDTGKELFSLQKRNIIKDAIKNTSDMLAAVDYISNSGERHALVEFDGNDWLVKGTHGSLKLQNNSENDDSLFELAGHKTVKFFLGRRLEFEPRNFKNEKPEQEFVTAVEFSQNYPYGKSVALINLKSKTIKTTDEWVVLPGIALAFILFDFTTEGCNKENDAEGMIMKEGFSSIPCTNGKALLGHELKANCFGPCSLCVATNGEGMIMKEGFSSIPCTNGKALLGHELKANCFGPCSLCVASTVKAASCACGPCKSEVIKAASCACGPCKSEVIKAASCACGPCKPEVIEAASCACGPCKPEVIKAASCACGPCKSEVIKAASCACGPCKSEVIEAVRSVCDGPYNISIEQEESVMPINMPNVIEAIAV